MRMSGRSNVQSSKSGVLDYCASVKDADSQESDKESVSVSGDANNSGVFVDSKGMAWIALKQACNEIETKNQVVVENLKAMNERMNKQCMINENIVKEQKNDATIIKTKPLLATKESQNGEEVYDMASIRSSALDVQHRLRTQETYISKNAKQTHDLNQRMETTAKKMAQTEDDCYTIANLLNVHHGVLSDCTNTVREHGLKSSKFEANTKQNMLILEKLFEETRLGIQTDMNELQEKMTRLGSTNSKLKNDSDNMKQMHKEFTEETNARMKILKDYVEKIENKVSNVLLEPNEVQNKISKFIKK